MPIQRPFLALGLALLAFIMPGTRPALAATPPAPVIALFTDYGWEDPYVAQMKGAILTVNPAARIIDLTHSVTPFNVFEGSYLLVPSAEEFPAGTIFVAVVDPQVGTPRDPVLVETKAGKYFVGPDNGLLSQVIDREGFSQAWKLDKPEYFRKGDPSNTFHGRDIFGPVAAYLASGVAPDKLGTPIKNLTMLPIKDPSMTNNTISVEVLHIDRYGNVILNFRNDLDLAAKLKYGNVVKISIGKDTHTGPLVKTYDDVEKGRLLLLYGGSGLLEIAMNQGSAAKELRVTPGEVIFLKP